MRGKMRPAAFILTVVMLFVLASPGCDNSSDTTGSTGPQANLVVTFTPNPVQYSRYGEWFYRVMVTETNGVGVHIYGWIRAGYSEAGEEYQPDIRTEFDFAAEFTACGGEGDYISGGETRCSDRRLYEGRNSGWQVWTFYGVDDFGNEVTGEGRLELL